MDKHGTRNIKWSTYIRYCNQLAVNIEESGYKPDVIVGIARGGLLPAQIIAYRLKIPTLLSYGISYYDSNNQLTEQHCYQPLPNCYDNSMSKFLWIDDIYDTGGTIRNVRDVCRQHKIVNYKIGVVLLRHGKNGPDFYSKIVNDNDWIIFPYE